MDAKLEAVFLRSRRLEDTEQDDVETITITEFLIFLVHVFIFYYIFRSCVNFFCVRRRGLNHEGQGMDTNGQIIDATTRDSIHIEGAIEKLLEEKIVLYKDYTSNFTCVEKNDRETTCSICLEEYKENDSVFFRDCHHLFHRECIERWLKQHDRKCPYCRMVMINNEELALYSR